MAGTQALSASRTPAFTLYPHDLILVTTPGERFYSPTVEDEVSDADVLDVALRGVLQSLRVRRTDAGSVVTAGRQRTKRALVVNALLGAHAYDGLLESVHQAIARLKNSPTGDRIVEIAMKKHGLDGVMLRAFAANSGSDVDEEICGLAEDEMRRGGSGSTWQVRAQRARALVEAGQPLERVAESMGGVSVATLRKWIARLSAPAAPPKPARAAAARPKMKVVKRIYARAVESGGLSLRECALLDFFAGRSMDEERLVRIFPELAPPKKEGEAAI